MLSRRTDARVDSMGILGSTARYAYLTREQRKRVATLAKQHAGDIPVMVCVGSVRIDAILHLADACPGSWRECPVTPGGQLPVTP